MKRFWIGICVLSLLLTSGIATCCAIKVFHTPISHSLDEACQAAVQEDWTAATAYFSDALARWQRCRDLTAALADHSVLEEIESLFAEIDVFRQTGDRLSFAAACAHLARLAEAVAQSHLPKWQNLL